MGNAQEYGRSVLFLINFVLTFHPRPSTFIMIFFWFIANVNILMNPDKEQNNSLMWCLENMYKQKFQNSAIKKGSCFRK